MTETSLARILKGRRGDFNARFAEKQITHPDLDGDAFLELLRQEVAPVMEAVGQVKAESALVVGQVLYDVVLDLFADGLLARDGVLAQVWRELLPSLASLLVQEPQRVAASVLNGAYNISQTSGARPAQWIAVMRGVAPLCADAETFLRAGQMAAWRTGMAQYRLDALQILKGLDGNIARVIFGLDADASEPDTSALHYALMANPWYVPVDSGQPTADKKELRVVKRVGAFRGFGGTFVGTPRVSWTRAGFVASDGSENYLLMADAFGATLHRIEKVNAESTAMPFKLGKDGTVRFGEVTGKFPELANATSSTANQTTLAVTTELSYGVYLIALAG